MVIFRSAEGKSGYHQAEALDEAIRFVERLRNAEGVEQARIFRLEEVPFEFRSYFRVEVAGAGATVPAPATAPEDTAPVESNGEPVPSGEGAGDVDAGPTGDDESLTLANANRRGLFGR